MAGTSADAGIEALVVDRRLVAAGALVQLRLADAALMRKLVSYVRESGVRPTRQPEGRRCDIRLLTPARIAVGGEGCTVVVEAARGTRIRSHDSGGADAGDVNVGRIDGRDVLEIGEGVPVELPLRLARGEFTPVLVRLSGGDGELRLTQRRGDGDVLAGFSILAGGA